MRIGFSTIGFLLNGEKFELNSSFVDEVEFVYDFDEISIPKVSVPISIHSPYFYTNLASLSKAHNEFSVKEISKALDFGLKTVVHEGSLTTRFNGYVSQAINIMKSSFEYLTERYKNIIVENTTGSLFSSFDDFVSFFSDFEVEFCFDVSHYFLKYGIFNKPIILKEKYLEKISKVHISDTVEGKDLHLPLGKGKVNFALVKDFIKDLRGDVSIIIESIPREGDVLKFYMEEVEKFREIINE
ncbi:TIM barrel protein [Caldisericum exile]|uniref:Xylose isomerase-like TIM barrel domain-containing protein n=1 Tax=Caldisericum exile (strain DSM 21853 / NBRC 104410 / AZM16c01) TaxID=511051 RepID=A0A7U6GDK5_CALEA|nr:TIM barrel protein [Caldisericum exile]BAL80426.1 hypothetical protein CSE_03000 [Caldisericum exile AZM16c01]